MIRLLLSPFHKKNLQKLRSSYIGLFQQNFSGVEATNFIFFKNFFLINKSNDKSRKSFFLIS